MACEADHRIFNGRDFLLDWECPIDQSSDTEGDDDNNRERVELRPKACGKQHKDPTYLHAQVFLPTGRDRKNEQENNLSNGDCLLVDVSVDTRHTDEGIKLCLANNTTSTGSSFAAICKLDSGGSSESLESDENTGGEILELIGGATKERVRGKLDWAEKEVERALHVAIETLNEKKQFLQGKLVELRRRLDEDDTNREEPKTKTPIRMIKSPRASPTSGNDGDDNGVFVRKMVTKTNKRKMEMKMLVDIEEIVKKTGNIAMTARTMSYMIPCLETALTSKCESDLEKPDLVDVIVVTINSHQVVLVTDFKNMCLKVLTGRNQGSWNSVLKFNNSPWGIARIDDCNVVVSVPLSNSICVVEVNTRLTLKDMVRTRKQYYGIVSVGSSVLVGTSPYSSPRSVDMFDLTGTVMKTMVVDSLLQQPSFICRAPSGTFVVSDLSKGALLSLSRDLGHDEEFYMMGAGQLCSSRGVATNDLGDIFVVDYQQKTVKVFSGKGEFVKDFLSSKDGIRYPYGVCFDEQGFLYVTDGGTVKVFSY